MHRLFDGLDEPEVARERSDGLPAVVLGRGAEDLLEGGVAVQEDEVGVEDEDADRRPVVEGAVPLLGLPERALGLDACGLVLEALEPLVQDRSDGGGDALEQAHVVAAEVGLSFGDDEHADRLVSVHDRRGHRPADGQVAVGHDALV